MPRNVVVQLCNGPICGKQNGYICDRLRQVQQKHPGLQIDGVGCQSQCERGPNLSVDGTWYKRMNPILASEVVKKSLSENQ